MGIAETERPSFVLFERPRPISTLLKVPGRIFDNEEIRFEPMPVPTQTAPEGMVDMHEYVNWDERELDRYKPDVDYERKVRGGYKAKLSADPFDNNPLMMTLSRDF